MSTLVDERIVSMGFDNKDFEKNVKQSMSTLDTLKSKLNFSGVANSMNDSLSSVSTNGLVSQLSNATAGFTAMEVVAISILNNITNKIVDMGLQLASSLSIDNISDGWTKYGQKVKSVGTLMAQTLRNEDGSVMSEAQKIENINKNLELLTFYADETSYSFSDMLNNITKFTGAGVSLDDATQAMMGSSNWAALSGQDAATAARVQLQLSQAMGVGAMTLIDWKSIQNANMATEEFKQNAMDAALAQGTLTKSINGTYKTLSGTEVTTSNFRNTLSEKWFSSDALLAVLKTYGSAVEDIYDVVQNNMDITLSSDAILLIGDDLDAFALKAYKAAQESRTLADALAAVKETVGTVYTGMFEAVFGVYDEAKQVWTDLVAVLYNLVVRDLVVKKKILDAWNGLGGRMDLFDRTEGDNGAFWNLLEAIQTIKDTIKDAWNIVFPLSELEDEGEMIADVGQALKDFTTKLKETSKGWILNADQIKVFKGILAGVFSIVKAFGKLIGAIWRGISPLVDLFKEIVGSILVLMSNAGFGLTEFVDKTLMFQYVGDMLFAVSTKIANALRSIGYWFGDVYAKMAANEQIQNGMTAVMDFFRSLPGYIITFVNAIKGSSISEIFNSLVDAMGSFFISIKNAFSDIGGLDTSSLDVVGEETVQKLNPLVELFKGLGSVLVGVFSVVNSILPVIGQAFSYLGLILQVIGDKISSVFTGESGVGIDKLMDIAFWTGMIFILKEMKDMFYNLIGIWNDLGASISGAAEGYEFKMKSDAIKNIALSLLIFAAALFIIAAIPEEGLYRAVAVLGVIGAVMIFLSASLERFSPLTKRISINSIFAAAKMKVAANAMIDFGKAILLFVASVWILSTIPEQELVSGIMGLIGITSIMLVFAKLISKNSTGFFVASYALLGMSGAMLLMSISLKALGTMDESSMNKGLAAMAGLTAIMLVFTALSKYVKKANRTAFSLIIFSTALTSAIIPLMVLSRLSWDQLAIGLAGISGIAGVLVLMAYVSKYVSGAILASVGIGILGASLLVFGVAIASLSLIQWDGIARALGAISLLVILVALVESTGGTALLAMAGLGVALIALSAGLIVFTLAMKALGSISWKQIGMALLVILTLLPISYILSAVLGILSPLLIAFGVALAVASGGLIIFGIAVALLGAIKFWTIVKGIVVFIGALALLGVASYFLAPLIPTMFALAAAMLIFGASIFTLGIGLSLVSLGLASFVGVALKSVATLLDAFLGLIPKLGSVIAALGTVLINALIEWIPKLMNLIEIILVKVLSILDIYGPQMMAVGVMLIMLLVQALADNFDPIAQAVVVMIIKLLGVIRENIEPLVDVIMDILDKLLLAIAIKIPEILDMLVETAADLVDGLIAAIGKLLGKIVDAAANLIITFIDALGTAIEDNAEPIREAIDRFMVHMWNAMLDFWGIHSPSTKMMDIAKNLIAGLVQGIADNAADIIAAGKDIYTQFKKGMTDNWHIISTYLSGRVTAIENTFTKLPETFKTIGKDLIDGFKLGLEEIDLGSVMDSVFGWLPQWIKDKLGIASPSKVFAELGGYVSEGMAVGLGSNTKLIQKEASGMAQGAVDGVEKSGISGLMAKLYEALNIEFEGGIVIRPVMDLTDIYEGKNQIYGMLDDLNSIRVDGSNDVASKASASTGKKSNSNNSNVKANSQNQVQTESQVINNTFNITGGNAKSIAQEVSKAIQNQVDRRHAQWAR